MLEASLASRIEALNHIFLAPGSTFSLMSLAFASLVSGLFFVLRRRSRGRGIRMRVLARQMLPLRQFLHASTGADAFLFFMHTMVFGALLGWAIVSQGWISARVVEGLASLFGAPSPSGLHPALACALVTLASFLAYEFGYWLFHWAAHTHPLLWEFHKIHHTAEVLTPLTVWRVHPVEQVVFINTLALVMGVCEGVGGYALGGGAQVYAISGTNVLLIVCVYAFVHLQHSQAWIPFTGIWGRLLLSPAHHQVHHSVSPLHHNRNMGSCLAIWDWAFGTLYVPARQREVERFGLGGDVKAPHDAVGALFEPFYRTAEHVARAGRATGLGAGVRDAAQRPAPADR